MGTGTVYIYLVCYDISDDRQRTAVSDKLLSYGDRVQKSVFEICVKTRRELTALQKQLAPLLAEGDDIRFYYLPPETRKQSSDVHGQPLTDLPAVFIVE